MHNCIYILYSCFSFFNLYQIYQQEEAEAVRLAKKQKPYMLLHADVGEVSAETKSSESRKPYKGDKKFRKKSVKSEDEDDKALCSLLSHHSPSIFFGYVKAWHFF